jgi:hypothetical protein
MLLPRPIADDLSTAAACALFGIHRATLIRHAKKLGIVPAIYGRDAFWSRADLDRIATARIRRLPMVANKVSELTIEERLAALETATTKK